MTPYHIRYATGALKELEKIPAKAAGRIQEKIKALANNPYPPGCKKMKGELATYRIRSGDYRVVYEVKEEKVIVLIVRIRHRKDAYR